VIATLCRQAGIELRSYAAADRPFTGRLAGVPLSEALRSMLRSESYLLGLRSDSSSGEPRITWLHVLGTAGSELRPNLASRAPAVSAAPPAQANEAAPAAAEFTIASSLLFRAFGTSDPDRRDEAQRDVLAQIQSAKELPVFLASDSKKLARVLMRYRGSIATVRRLQTMSDDAEVQEKLGEIMAEIQRGGVEENNEPLTEP
jgi:hypothetical protein